MSWYLRDDVSVWLVPKFSDSDDPMALNGGCSGLVVEEEDALFPQPDQFRSPLIFTCSVDVFEFGEYLIFLEAPKVFLVAEDNDSEGNVKHL
mgnify:CR=1 FL=1